ncbi:MAG: HPF/RaiA family ribosome-associated protein [Thermodesulfobacteriota bacterium]|nr:HPF/RaiA family ribosome-associated protein [Thermodesulfobacteriota bacterium]MEA3428515.1 HPF/RaiA family ribosome-associated protein [Thermodesulfobacteriota bacterium]
MKIPLQITARNFDLTETIEGLIREKAQKLDLFYDQIMRCRVLVEAPHRRRHKGVLFNTRIDITVPGGEIVIKREPHEDLYVSIGDAFRAAQRQIEDYDRERRRKVKYHEEMPRAIVSTLFPERGYGFLATPDGREFYFHKNSVLDDKFKVLKVGMKVRFVEELGEKGAQASTVKVK